MARRLMHSYGTIKVHSHYDDDDNRWLLAEAPKSTPAKKLYIAIRNATPRKWRIDSGRDIDTTRINEGILECPIVRVNRSLGR
jgi:hypothetical protein